MTTPQHSTADRSTAPATDPYAPSATALRVIAGIGLLLVAACWVATMVVTLTDAISDDGVGGGFVTAGFWAVGLAAVAGVVALAVPRRALVAAQYALALAGPVLALMD
ncbi:hypothetical protein [Streptomyces sp. CC208A]|uniref:hypothetical protein n=1 Tax=Streptomyces sp. CC208A TaxID=3044573 RepID=UPI0024A97980|nr:hypothetical protein [Streptomyces sp. CC208A]